MDPTRVAPLGKRRRFSNAVYLTFSNKLIGMEKDTEGLVGWLVGWLARYQTRGRGWIPSYDQKPDNI